jgi:hypothetical protein
VARLPKDISALDAIKLWRSSAWCLEDGEFSSKLEAFAWTEEALGPDFQIRVEMKEMGQVADSDSAVALGFLSQPDVMSWASYVLRACLAISGGLVEKFFIAGKDDTIARLLFVAFYCLPERLRRGLTFSTHENPKGTKGVQIVGVTTFEGAELDLPSYCYNGKYCALNTFNETKTDSLAASSFAESAIQWILYGQYGLLAQVREGFDALDPADKPTIGDLDLLAEHPVLGDDVPMETEGLLKLCGSAAIGHSKVRDLKELSVLVGQAESSSGYRDRLVSQLVAWLPQHSKASEEFPVVLAQIALARLQEGQSFGELAWLATLAGQISPGLDRRFWEAFLMACQPAAGQWASGKAPVPMLDTRLNLLQEWEKLPNVKDQATFRGLVDCWLRVTPRELIQVLNSSLLSGLKREAVRLCLTGSALLDAQTAEAMFSLICRDVQLIKEVFLNLPKWQERGVGAIGKVPDGCLSKLLACHVEQMTLVDSLDEPLVETVGLWDARVPKLMPARMRAILSLGRYLKSPASVMQVTELAPELVRPDFWSRERDKEEVVNGAVDRLLECGSLSDYERALDWFGDRKWASSSMELIRLTYRRLVNVQIGCRDGALQRIILILGVVLKEWEEAGRGGSVATSSGSVAAGDLEGSELNALGRIAMHHLPGSSFLKSPAGHQIINVLCAESQCLEPIQKGWIENLHSLLELCNATVFDRRMIETLARCYKALDKEGDADVRAEVINALVFNAISENPKALKPALWAFVNNVYTKDESLFLIGFMPHLLEELVRLEQKSESGAVAEVFVSFCIEGCFLERAGGNFADRRSTEMNEWLRHFKSDLSPRSISRVNRYAKGWEKRSRERWYRESGYRPSWISAWLSDMKERRGERRRQKKQGKLTQRYSARRRKRERILVLAIAALGLVGWSHERVLRQHELNLQQREPVEQGKQLSAWLDQYGTPLAEQDSGREERREQAVAAIQKIGTNALPSLVRMVGTKDSAIIDKTVVRMFHLQSENDYHTRAIQGFDVLGSVAKPAVPDLIKSLGDKSPGVRACAASCLGLIGPEAKAAVPDLRKRFDDQVVSVRKEATNSVAKIDAGAAAKTGVK